MLVFSGALMANRSNQRKVGGATRAGCTTI